MSTTTSDLLDNAAAARFLNVSPTTLTTWRCRRTVEVPFIRIGSAIRYDRRDLIEFLEKCKVRPRDEKSARGISF
jgi:hypothetical protein